MVPNFIQSTIAFRGDNERKKTFEGFWSATWPVFTGGFGSGRLLLLYYRGNFVDDATRIDILARIGGKKKLKYLFRFF